MKMAYREEVCDALGKMAGGFEIFLPSSRRRGKIPRRWIWCVSSSYFSEERENPVKIK